MELWPSWFLVATPALVALGLIHLHYHRRSKLFRAFALVAARCTAAILLLMAVILAVDNTNRHTSLYDSPDRLHVARVVFTSGYLPYPSKTTVIVRRSGSPFWQEAYRGDGNIAGGGEASPYILWIDDSHLVVHYHNALDPTACAKNIGAIVITCINETW